jgi:tetratricopeptide (TPR) repeat protein
LEEGELPSGEEALAWLEQLTAGKEEELQARADAEAEARLAEIMGRPQAAEAPPVEEVEEAIAPPVEEPFGWTGFGPSEAPPEPIAAAEEAPALEEAALVEEEPPTPAWLEGEELPSGEEALAWLEQLTAGKEEELQAQADAETEARLAEIMGRAPAAEAPPAEVAAEPVAPPIEEALVPPLEAAAPAVEEPFGWTGFGAPEVPPEPAAAAEEVPTPEEPALPEIPEPAYAEEAMPPPVPEFPAVEETVPSEEVHWGAVPELPAQPEKAPAPVIEEVPGVVEMEMTAPPVEAVAVPEPPVEEAPVVKAPPIPAEPYAAERRYLKEHSRDYEAWLALARALWQDGEREESREAYSRVIRAGKLLESVIDDLEGYVEWKAEAGTQRVLGDAYMKDGRLQQALNTYRRALETL